MIANGTTMHYRSNEVMSTIIINRTSLTIKSAIKDQAHVNPCNVLCVVVPIQDRV